MTDDTRDRQERAALVALVAKWRKAAHKSTRDVAAAIRNRADDLEAALSALPSGETTHEERTDMPKSISCREFGLCAKDPSRGLGNFCEQCPAVK